MYPFLATRAHIPRIGRTLSVLRSVPPSAQVFFSLIIATNTYVMVGLIRRILAPGLSHCAPIIGTIVFSKPGTLFLEIWLTSCLQCVATDFFSHHRRGVCVGFVSTVCWVE